MLQMSYSSSSCMFWKNILKNPILTGIIPKKMTHECLPDGSAREWHFLEIFRNQWLQNEMQRTVIAVCSSLFSEHAFPVAGSWKGLSCDWRNTTVQRTTVGAQSLRFRNFNNTALTIWPSFLLSCNFWNGSRPTISPYASNRHSMCSWNQTTTSFPPRSVF